MIKKKKLLKLTPLQITPLVIGIVASLGLIVLVPAHFSITAVCVIVFCIYSLYTKALAQENKHLYAHAIVLVVLMALVYGTYAAIMTNQNSSCAAFFGERVPCFSYEDLTYVYAEVLGSGLVIGAIARLHIAYKKRTI